MDLLKTIVMVTAMVLGYSSTASATYYHPPQHKKGGSCEPSECIKYSKYDKEYIYSDYIYGPTGEYSWSHDGVGIEDTLTKAKLYIQAWDVDYGEIDTVYAYSNDSSDWVSLGNLTGKNNKYSWTGFSLGSDWFEEIVEGLKLKVLFTTEHYAAKLKWSKLFVEGEYCPPSEVPVPAAFWLFGTGLLGFTAMRKRQKS